jgi:hypothetical protein
MRAALGIIVLVGLFYAGQLVYDHYLITDQAIAAKARRHQ